MTPYNVAAVVNDGCGTFGVGVAHEVFGYDRTDRGMPRFDFALVAPRPGPVRTDTGLVLQIEHGLERLAHADLINVLSWEDFTLEPQPKLLEALVAAYDRGAILASQCSGAYVLAATGLLDGRRATTHWRYADALARRFPAVHVDPDVLYVDEGRLLTSAGTAAAIDLCLYLLRREFGAGVANAIARDMVMPPHRDGGQKQYIQTPVPSPRDGSLADVLSWMAAHLDRELSVDALSARALMSPRTFARRFRAETGTTPFHWLTGQRVLLAQRLLEETDETLDMVAELCGFGTAAVLRHHFVRQRGTTPQSYRRAFRRVPA
jgi:transcriptional regulator GlxA family with amidase domain